jgi:hypothetical protein
VDGADLVDARRPGRGRRRRRRGRGEDGATGGDEEELLCCWQAADDDDDGFEREGEGEEGDGASAPSWLLEVMRRVREHERAI